MRPTRILGIAPYEGMRAIMLSIAESMPDVEMTAFVGDLETGVALAAQYAGKADVILSRGGTAELIRQQATLPIVEIELSAYDILRSIKLAENTNSHFSVVGFPSITQRAAFLGEILQSNIDLHTIHSTEEARDTLKRLAKEACPAVLCDMITNSIAREFGIPSILITSGRESIAAAIRQAVTLTQTLFHLQEHSQRLQAALMQQCDHIALFGSAGQAYWAHHRSPLPAKIDDAMQRLGQNAQACTEVIELPNELWSLTATPLSVDAEPCTSVTAHSTNTNLSLVREGISFFNQEETFNRFYHSFYGITNSSSLDDDLAQYAMSNRPLMIIGEPGTGKDQMVRLLYAKGKYASAPLCALDCALLQETGWQFLFQSDSSPLRMNGITLHFRNMSALDEKHFTKLFALLNDIGFATRNRMLFTASISRRGTISPFHRQILSQFSCQSVTMPPLRERRKDIPYLAGLYISTLNLTEPHEIVGFAPEALSLLQDYDWPDNHDQFVRILHNLWQMTTTPYISAESTALLLRQEKQYFTADAPSLASFVQGRTLDQMSQEIVQQVLAQEKGNQTTTAQRLGLSRTTLWRMLQRKDKEN